jgi:proteasome lid subunit RPN8/RPN11
VSSTTLHLPTRVAERLRSAARSGAPEEVCGVLLGTGRESETIRVTDSRAVANVADAPRTRYELDPTGTAAVFASVDDGSAADREQGSPPDPDRAVETTDVVGFYHSHPRGPPGPSPTDRDQAQWPGYVYLIVSLGSGIEGETGAEVGAWRWTGDGFVSLTVQVGDDAPVGDSSA